MFEQWKYMFMVICPWKFVLTLYHTILSFSVFEEGGFGENSRADNSNNYGLIRSIIKLMRDLVVTGFDQVWS